MFVQLHGLQFNLKFSRHDHLFYVHLVLLIGFVIVARLGQPASDFIFW